MEFNWWFYLLILNICLTIFSILANNRRYKYFRIAYSFYKKLKEENFLDYVLMKNTSLEKTTINDVEVYLIKKKEIFWSKASTISYGAVTIICAIIMISSFYGILTTPKLVQFLFLIILICSAYINYRSWRYFKFRRRI